MSVGGLADQGRKPRVPIWPIVLAPVIAGIYYLALKLAFVESAVAVLGRTDLFEAPHWGSHWGFRLTAEAISVGFGTFVAAALAPGREQTAAVVGGCAISLGFAAKLALVYSDPAMFSSAEPWYQYSIDALSIVLAP